MKKDQPVFAPLFAAYMATVLIVRGTFLAIGRFGLPEPQVQVNGVHIHHYLFGIAILFLVAISAINQRFSRKTLSILLGISLAMITDEFQFLVKLAEVKYPVQELDTISLVGILLLVSAAAEKYALRKSPPIPKLDFYPKFSVVIPTYNEEKYIASALRSLKQQKYPSEIEIIVADNNSTDKTLEIARKYNAKIVLERQKGAVFARQAGFKRATNQIIATTDADTILPSNWVLKLAYEFQKYPSAVAITGMYQFYDGSPILRSLTYLFNYPVFSVFHWYSGANMAVKRNTFNQIGGFNTNILIGEDSNLCQRLKKTGSVLRLANFKVLTSARRFNKLGLIGGLWNYSYNYARLKISLNQKKHYFRPGSEIPKLGLIPKLAIHLAFWAAVLGGLFGIRPIRAEMFEQGKNIRHYIPHLHMYYRQRPAKYHVPRR